MELSLKLKKLSDATESTVVVAVAQDESKENLLLNSHKEYATDLEELRAADVFKGAKNSTYFLRGQGGKNLLFVGLGKPSQLTGESLRLAGAHASRRLESEKVAVAALSLDSLRPKGTRKVKTPADGLQAFAEGALLGLYSFDTYKSKKDKRALGALVVYSGENRAKAALEGALRVATETNRAVGIARDLSNEPANVVHPMELAKRAQALCKEYGLSFKLLDMAALKKEKMGALIGVGQGSANPPCLFVMEYKPAKAKKRIAFVGKGITFDSGGISLKPGAGMDDMKHDMSGAADVIAATLLAARLKSPNHIIGVIAAAENMPDGNAFVPSAILTARSGKTIEIQNTDAEGRLILSDALDYAQDYEPQVVINVATLTGAVVVALGNVTAGVMGNDQGLIDNFMGCADATEEKFWQLPLYQEYCDDIKSKVADIKNMGGEKGAGSQKGGAFLKEFIRPGVKWAHLDVAGTAWNMGFLAYNPRSGATGHSVRTLVRFALDY